jgi:DNA adenine methylase
VQLDLSIKRPAVRYHGGKFRLAPWIVGFFPAHHTYVEPFAGGAGVLLRKEPSAVEIYNDLDGDVVNFFRVLRGAETRAQLLAALCLTPFSREEYKACFVAIDDPVERARRFIARAQMGFGSHSHNIANVANGWRAWGPNSRKNYARELFNLPEALSTAGERLANVNIEHQKAERVIARYDHADTLFYVDPPYVRSERTDQSKGYAHEMTDGEHEQLAWQLRQVKGKVVLSGYASALYDALYHDWRREEKNTAANGQNGSVERTEVLWMNFKPSPTP